MTHSPEPWSNGPSYQTDHVIWDATGECVGRIYERDDEKRIVACVNACQGLPNHFGAITMVADMKAAILSNNPQLLENVRTELVRLSENNITPTTP